MNNIKFEIFLLISVIGLLIAILWGGPFWQIIAGFFVGASFILVVIKWMFNDLAKKIIGDARISDFWPWL